MDSRLLMTLELALGAPQMVGPVSHGTRVVVPVASGRFEGPRLRGRVLPGGVDSTLLRSDGVLELDARMTLETDDGALVHLAYRGLRHGPPEVIAALGRGEPVDPGAYYFRSTARLDTGHAKYAFLNRLLAIAVGERRSAGPAYAVHEIL